METVGGEKSTAPTEKLFPFKPYIGQKLGQELVDSWFDKIEEYVIDTTLEFIETERIYKLLDLEPRYLGNQL